MIPKIVNANAGSNYNWKEKVVSRYAPFATNDTPATSVKIIGGRLVIVENSNGNSNGRASDDARRTPMQGRPSVDTYHTSANISRESDANQLQHFTHTNVGETQRSLNTNYLLPPIPTDRNQSRTSADRLDGFIMDQPNLGTRGMNPLGVERHLPDVAMLPDKPLRLSLSEEVELRQRVAEDLQGLSSQVLKDFYLKLAAFDPKLTGYVHFNDLTFSLLRSQVNLSMCNERLLAALFLSEAEPNKIRYEQLLYFLSSSMKRNSELMRSDFTRGRRRNDSRSEFQNPPSIDREPASDREFHQFHGNLSNNSNRVDTDTTAPTRKSNLSRRTNYETSQLLRIVEEQLKERGAGRLDIDRIWDMFRHADRSCSQVLSREEIKTLAYQCKIRLDEDILDQVIDRCHKGNDRYWWEQFLNFIGRFLVHKTSLIIAGRPKDFAKPYSPLGFNQVDPEDHVNRGFVSKEGRLAAVEKKEKELAKLEKIIQITRQRLDELRRTSILAEPWLKRFMSLAHAMYECDDSKAGYMTAMVAVWLTREYSRGLELGLMDEAIQMAIRRSTDDGTQAVSVEQLLRTLVSQG